MIQSAHVPITVDGRRLIDDALQEQRSMTAVGRFSRQHEAGELPEQARYYRDLIPLDRPTDGQQYAFEVDLDACTGCKACVTACHNLNGLDDDEAWRDVGMLVGGPLDDAIAQHVTTACHHCVDPACMSGCPVNAYEKDAATGIVHHLDDQCIGCQYCILKCPYDVPKFNKSKGIVRKCDMCSQRLAVGEAPACVQACPNEAIRITIVDQSRVEMTARANRFLPGAAAPDYTKPTTTFKSAHDLDPGLTPADLYSVEPEHAHLPLVFMLVLTQLSVGALLVERFIGSSLSSSAAELIRPVHALAALLVGIVALGASTMHLGRPLYAFRAIIGLRTSWLSREIVAFGGFAKLAAAYAVLMWFWPGLGWLGEWLVLGAIGAGAIGVFCSAMIYDDTRRAFWSIAITGPKFALTTLLLGVAATLLVTLGAAATDPRLTVGLVMAEVGPVLCGATIALTVLKLMVDSMVFVRLRDAGHPPLKRTAVKMIGPLIGVTLRRYTFAIVGGIVAPAILLGESVLAAGGAYNPVFVIAMASLIFLLCLLGELSERYLFFTAVVSNKMPGGVM